MRADNTGEFCFVLPFYFLFVPLLAGCGSKQKEADKLMEQHSKNPYICPPGLVVKAPSVIITDSFCKANDITIFLDFGKNGRNDSEGAFGIFDSSMWRMQIIFTSVRMNPADRYAYLVEGVSRIKKKVRYFAGSIHIDTVRLYDRNYWFSKDTCDFADTPEFLKMLQRQYDEKNLELGASFVFKDVS